MKHTLLISAFILSLFTTPAFAAGETVTIGVNGMVCDFCARAIEKVFGRENAVQDVKVDLSAKTITVYMKDGLTIPDTHMTELVNNAGYDVREITHVKTDAVTTETDISGAADE